MCLNSRRHILWLLWAVLISGGATVSLAAGVHDEPSISSREDLSIRDKGRPPTDRDDAEKLRSKWSAVEVAVRHVKLERDQPIDGAPTSTLMFDVYNEAGASVTDVIVSVSLLDATAKDFSAPRIIVGPFKIHLKEVLLADYSVHYALRLRNLSSDCGCVPAIEVIDARVLVGSDLEYTLPSNRSRQMQIAKAR